jgi:hypothetical protein
MELEVVVAIHVIEGKTGVPECLELGTDFSFQLVPYPRLEEKHESCPDEMGGELACRIHEAWNGVGR